MPHISMVSTRRQTSLTPALVAPLVTRYFEALNVAATLVLAEQPGVYHPIFRRRHARDPLQLEHRSDAFARRLRYNERMVARAEKQGTLAVGKQGLFIDLFMPVVSNAKTLACVIVGPFVEERPTARQIAAEFERLSRRRPSPRDPEFVAFLRGTLSTTVLAGRSRLELERFLRSYAALLGGPASAAQTFAEFEELWAGATQHQPEQRMWRLASGLVDAFESLSWRSAFGVGERAALGITKLPNQVLALQADSQQQDEIPGEALVRADAFQHSLVRWARSQPGTLVGRVGDEGAFVLVHLAARRQAERRRELYRLSRELQRFCQRSLGLSLRVGVGGVVSAPEELAHCYQQALAALNVAFREGERVVFWGDHAESDRASAGPSFDAHAAALEQSFQEGNSAALASSLQSFLQATAWRAAFNLEVVQALLESVLGRLLRALRSRGLLQKGAFAARWQRYLEEAGRLRSSRELSLLFERTVLELAAAFVDERHGDRATRLQLAGEYVERNYREPLSLAALARRSGFSASYFSSLFKAHHGIGFERYLAEARLRRARASSCALASCPSIASRPSAAFNRISISPGPGAGSRARLRVPIGRRTEPNSFGHKLS